MSRGLKITLKGGERIYINGAVLKMDRKVGIEILNEATFLLEQHILQPEGATSPLRQIYFMVQTMLIDPSLHAKASDMANEAIEAMRATVSNEEIVTGLGEISRLLVGDRTLEALKKLRSMYPVEAAYLGAATNPENMQKEVA